MNSSLYNLLFKRNSTFIATVFASAFFLKIGLDVITDKVWEKSNAGMQWKDVKPKFLKKEEEDDEDEE
ncbi:ubiquinol-cytochrome-c reductase complex subunit 9 [Schizosaccharomyces japonicus yFS275]|uniref:Complex III subunit 9 n=1 Tax=Schizosaccharomyces japonicus (strain yFS275 / FY16936) TaxID=402676 RepID=B6JYU3_SCHJY|nr:ubiquinol-cytochrome-c reductase complex subunit 9 [Schizosaccharomyces japonicus yFS275]EEB06711.2 ubiquinol-cytochrome-c reductase complex subunit 9 [Schizosaccharomyces japonicus yFS275]